MWPRRFSLFESPAVQNAARRLAAAAGGAHNYQNAIGLASWTGKTRPKTIQADWQVLDTSPCRDAARSFRRCQYMNLNAVNAGAAVIF